MPLFHNRFPAEGGRAQRALWFETALSGVAAASTAASVMNGREPIQVRGEGEPGLGTNSVREERPHAGPDWQRNAQLAG